MKKTNTAPVAVVANDRNQRLQLALSSINKEFGSGSIMSLGGRTALDVETLSTGDISVDRCLGVGGLPKGRIVEVYGPESSGKTTLCLSVVAEAQRQGGTAAIIDVEHALDPVWARKLGVNTEALLVSQPDSGEDALNIMETLVRSGAVDVVILDSVAALTTKAELDGQMGDATVGAQARLMSQAMRRLTAVVSKTKCVCIFTNQIREKIGVMFGNPETTPGGRALKFFASLRLDVRKKDLLKDPAGTVMGNRVKLKVVKNKVAAPFTECEFDIYYDEGISRSASLLEVGVKTGVLGKKGAWFTHDGELVGQGQENARQALRANPALFAKIEGEIRAKLAKETVREAVVEASPAPAVTPEAPVVPAEGENAA